MRATLFMLLSTGGALSFSNFMASRGCGVSKEITTHARTLYGSTARIHADPLYDWPCSPTKIVENDGE